MIDLPLSEVSTWYERLQAHPELDQRDNRGKRHKLSLVLLEMLMSLLRGRDGTLSSLHRSMVSLHDQVCEALGLAACRVISRSQLPLVLGKVKAEVFEKILHQHWQLELSADQLRWFAADGKSLRGSIPPGASQGQHIVQLVSHQEREVVSEAFYSGDKEREIPTLRQLLSQGPYRAEAISMDALHCNPKTLKLIAGSGGQFLVGLKENQPELLQEMERASHILAPVATQTDTEKGHGRIETRTYYTFDVQQQYFEPRWEAVGFQTLIKVERQRLILKSGHQSQETSFFMANIPPDTPQVGSKAVRNHWQIEVNNHIRDVTLQEDQLRSKKHPMSQTMARLRTVAIKILKPTSQKNCKAKIEEYQDHVERLLYDLRAQKVL